MLCSVAACLRRTDVGDEPRRCALFSLRTPRLGGGCCEVRRLPVRRFRLRLTTKVTTDRKESRGYKL